MSLSNADEEWVREAFPKDKAYDMWLARIDRIERFTVESPKPGDSIDIGFFLFPLIDTVATNLGLSFRKYLEILGVKHADLIYKVFRNGLLHNGGNYHLYYDDDEEIGWAMSSSGGSGGFRQYDVGYTSKEYPEDNIPPEKVFEYVLFEDNFAHASLSLDRLAALLRHDLLQRKASDKRKEIEVIVGKKISGKRPTPDKRSLG